MPSIINYFTDWKFEIENSKKAWKEFNLIQEMAKEKNIKLQMKHIEHLKY